MKNNIPSQMYPWPISPQSKSEQWWQYVGLWNVFLPKVCPLSTILQLLIPTKNFFIWLMLMLEEVIVAAKFTRFTRLAADLYDDSLPLCWMCLPLSRREFPMPHYSLTTSNLFKCNGPFFNMESSSIFPFEITAFTLFLVFLWFFSFLCLTVFDFLSSKLFKLWRQNQSMYEIFWSCCV